jgi:putative oxidoreductase
VSIPERIAIAFLGLPFLWLGFEAVADPGNRVNLAKRIRMPKPEWAVRFNGAAMMLGGLGLITGVLARLAALGLIVSLIPTTIAGHSFWRESEKPTLKASRIQFLKNLGLAAGLAVIAFSAQPSAITKLFF